MKRPILFGMTGAVILLVGFWAFFSFAASPAAALRIESGKQVTLHYKLLVDGKVLEVADDKQPFIYKQGEKQIIPGLEKALEGLEVGAKKTIKVAPEEGYGQIDPNAVREIAKEKLPPDVPLKPGTLMEAHSPQGDALLVKIKEVKDKTVLVDFNHPLAGKNLEFQVEVVQVSEPGA